MGGLVIERIRPGVEFVPDAAAAFRRADAQVRAEFGRGIDVNSTYRSWSDQMEMFEAWNRYVASGYRPALKPNHSKAVHPSESFHVAGTALDSDDWVNARIVEILADDGFIRNRLHVPGEQHHFEYIRDRDNHRGEPISAGGATAPRLLSEEDDMKFLHIDNDGSGKKAWVLVNVATGKVLSTTSQKKANGWALVWGNARTGADGGPMPRQEFLNALDAIKKTS